MSGLALPLIFLWELSLGLWLTFKGFRPSILAPDRREQGITSTYAAA